MHMTHITQYTIENKNVSIFVLNVICCGIWDTCSVRFVRLFNCHRTKPNVIVLWLQLSSGIVPAQLISIMMSLHWNALCITRPLWGESPVTGGLTTQRASNAKVWCFFVVCMSKMLSKQSSCLWFEMPGCSFWHNLAHWGRVTHICVSKLTIIGSDTGLSPGRRQAIIWTNAGILLIRPLGTNFSQILSEIHAFSFKNIHLNISSGKWQPFCLGPQCVNGCWKDMVSYSLFTAFCHHWLYCWIGTIWDL